MRLSTPDRNVMLWLGAIASICSIAYVVDRVAPIMRAAYVVTKPSDHAAGYRVMFCSPKTCVADSGAPLEYASRERCQITAAFVTAEYKADLPKIIDGDPDMAALCLERHPTWPPISTERRAATGGR